MKRIRIMRGDPVVHHEGQEIHLSGRPSKLFRLLVLNEGATVGKRAIAELHDTSEDHAASKIRYLKEQLVGCQELIENDHSTGYRFSHDGQWIVDAAKFRSVVDSIDGIFDLHDDRVIEAPVARERVKEIEGVLEQWAANPGLDLPGQWERKFDRLKRRAEDSLLKARLCTRDHFQLRDAVQELERRVRSHEAGQLEWTYLLLAYDALGSEGQVKATWGRIGDHFKGTTPHALNEAMERIRKGVPNPFRIEIPVSNGATAEPSGISDRTNTEPTPIESLCSTLGITTASALRLEGSHLTPMACIRRARSRLYFMGVLSSKWVTDAGVRSAFKKLLTRLDAINGDVRFLIINPNGDGFRRLSELRQGHVSTESIGPLLQLASEHSSFKVRMYNNLPAFRIIVIDDDVVSFSPYRLAAAAYLTTERGWESPHVVLDPLATYPLAEAFQLLFLETWESAEPLGVTE